MAIPTGRDRQSPIADFAALSFGDPTYRPRKSAPIEEHLAPAGALGQAPDLKMAQWLLAAFSLGERLRRPPCPVDYVKGNGVSAATCEAAGIVSARVWME